MESLLNLGVKLKECSKMRVLLHKMEGNLYINKVHPTVKNKQEKKNKNV